MEYFSVFVFARSRRGLIVTEHRQRRRDGAEGDRHVDLTGKKKIQKSVPCYIYHRQVTTWSTFQ